jgi:hypothetical protein
MTFADLLSTLFWTKLHRFGEQKKKAGAMPAFLGAKANSSH